MGSSSWSNAYRYDTDGGKSFFVKEAKGQDGTMFKGEALGLQAMYGARLLSVEACLLALSRFCLQATPTGLCWMQLSTPLFARSAYAPLGLTLAL